MNQTRIIDKRLEVTSHSQSLTVSVSIDLLVVEKERRESILFELEYLR